MSFEEKKNLLFASLETAERCIGNDSVLRQPPASELTVARTHGRQRSGTDSLDERTEQKLRKLRGKESIFKRPEAPLWKCLQRSKPPDFQKNPHRWTKYSLEDVDTSDRSNTSAAFSFLRQMEERNGTLTCGQPAEPTVEIGGTQRVQFNRSFKLKAILEDEPPATASEEDRTRNKGAKVIMPEYVVGQRIRKPSRRAAAKVGQSRTNEMKLDHLMEEEEEQEEQ